LLADSPLGRASQFPERYDPSLLFAVPRAAQRAELGLGEALPFQGVVLWTAYELSWLGSRGLPRCAVLRIDVPASSPAVVESKSLKLYLGSFSQTSFDGDESLCRRIQGDLSRICGTAVDVLLAAAETDHSLHREALPGDSIDAIAVAIDTYQPDPSLLQLDPGTEVAEETLRSALFKSKCPVTGQPDYADVLVRYRGRRIMRASLLRYLVSFRRHAAFHEACVERIFVDIIRTCNPSALTVYARFLRRGGIDINPFRSNFEHAPSPRVATPRQ
jgi:7-cyano-7-deazaguanine reductase